MRKGIKTHYYFHYSTKIEVGQFVDLMVNSDVVETILISYIHFNRDNSDEIWLGKVDPYTGKYIGKSEMLNKYSEIRETTNMKVIRRKMIESLNLLD